MVCRHEGVRLLEDDSLGIGLDQLGETLDIRLPVRRVHLPQTNVDSTMLRQQVKLRIDRILADDMIARFADCLQNEKVGQDGARRNNYVVSRNGNFLGRMQLCNSSAQDFGAFEWTVVKLQVKVKYVIGLTSGETLQVIHRENWCT